MMPGATNMGSGQCLGMPDTLYDLSIFSSTGVTVPVPGPNTAMHTPGQPTAMTVMAGTGQALTISTIISTTISPGVSTLTGLVSQVVSMNHAFCQSSTRLMLKGQPAVYSPCMCTQNMANCSSGAQAVPSQVKVLFPM